jgi:hypothetical protein
MNLNKSVLILIFMLAACDSRSITEAKRAVEKDLKDPSSVEYRNVLEYSESIVCGEYNAKNGYGAYVGYTEFIFYYGQVLSTPSLSDTELLCSNNPKKIYIYQYLRTQRLCEGSRIESKACQLAEEASLRYKEKYPDDPLPIE